jgi:hypothetical protein
MARLRRRWRVVKWAGLILAVLTALTWASTHRRGWAYAMDGRQHCLRVTLASGCLDFTCYDLVAYRREWINVLEYRPLDPSRVNRHPNMQRVILAPPEPGLTRAVHPHMTAPHRRYYLNAWSVGSPFWVPLLIVALPTVALFWLDRRRIPSHCCQGCGYDLTGNTSGACPECGNNSTARATNKKEEKSVPTDHTDEHR